MAGKVVLQGSLGRALYGVLALLFPKLLLRGVGMNEVDLGADARYFNRLFGGRDLLVAGASVAAVRRGAVKDAIATNIVCEVTDSISMVEEIRARGSFDRMTAIGLAFNVVGYATWTRAALALRADEPTPAT